MPRLRTIFRPSWIFLSLGLWLFTTQTTLAQNNTTTFRAEIVQGIVARGEMVILRFTLQTNERRYSSLRLPRHRALRYKKTEKQDRQDAVYRPGQDASIRYTWTFTASYQARRFGTHTLRPASVRVKGKLYKTQALTIEIKSEEERAPKGPMLEPPEDIEAPSDFFLYPVVSHKSPFIGQQTTVSFFFFRRGTCSVAYAQLPRFEGFWVEELYRARSLSEWKRRKIGDKEYAYTLVSRYALFGLRAGEALLDALALRINPQMNADPSNEKIIRSPEHSVQIQAFPEEDKPSTLQPQDVGRFHLDIELPTQTYRVGQTIPLQIRLKGLGNLKQITLPSLKLPTHLQQISARSEVSLKPQHAQIRGEILSSLWIKAQKKGEYTIPSLVWWAFDPWKKEYIRYQTPPKTLSILASLQTAHTTAQKTKPLQTKAKPHPLSPQRHPLFVLLFFLGVAAGVALLAKWRSWQQERFARAALEAQRQLQHDHYLHAKRILQQWADTNQLPSDPQGLSRIEATFHELLQALLLRPTRALTRQELQEDLSRHHLGQSLYQDLNPLLHQCDLARFAPWPCPDAETHILRHLKSLVPQLPEEAPQPPQPKR